MKIFFSNCNCRKCTCGSECCGHVHIKNNLIIWSVILTRYTVNVLPWNEENSGSLVPGLMPTTYQEIKTYDIVWLTLILRCTCLQKYLSIAIQNKQHRTVIIWQNTSEVMFGRTIYLKITSCSESLLHYNYKISSASNTSYHSSFIGSAPKLHEMRVCTQ